MIISSRLNERPPLKAMSYPNSLISSKNCAVRDVPEIFNTSPIISRRAFFVITSLIYPTSLGTRSLNRILPQVVSTNCKVGTPSSFKSNVFTLI